MLAKWARDAAPGERLTVEKAVNLMTGVPAEVMGFADRGRIRLGAKADINVIDLDRVNFRRPRVVFDLPSGGRRMVQDSGGYIGTIVSGAITQRDGRPTGAHPGRLVRDAGILN